MSVINTNVSSLMAQNSMTINNRSMSKAMEQLSTGKRINSSGDDAAGLSISETMTSQIRGLNQAVRNANDGVSMLQTAEGGLVEVSNMLQRMRELAVQSATDTNSTAQQTALDDEYQALGTEIDRILVNTSWNGMSLFDESAGRAADGTFTLQVGAGSDGGTGGDDSIDVDLSGMTDTTDLMGAIGDITDSANALTEIAAVDVGITAVNTMRSTIGATINRLNYAADNMTNISTNTAASRSRILDTDYAAATTELARTQIIQQAATAMLAQANQQPQSVLALLK
jgi:flagellin